MQKQHSWMDVERRSGTYQFGVREGREEGRTALRELIFEVLAERGVVVDAQHAEQIRTCENLPTLQRWLRRAMHATTIAELFD